MDAQLSKTASGKLHGSRGKKKTLKRLQQKKAKKVDKQSGRHGNTSCSVDEAPPTDCSITERSKGGQGMEKGGKKRGRGRGRGKRKKLTKEALHKELAEDGTGSKVGKKKQKRRNGGQSARGIETQDENGTETRPEVMEEESGMETVAGMEAWQSMGVPHAIIRALSELGFTSPTEIQRQAIPVAMDTGRDVIGAAETGSGKTLAFSIPILSYILGSGKAEKARKRKKQRKEKTIGSRSPKPQTLRRETEGEGEVEYIDLNVVLHYEDEGERGGEEEEAEEVEMDFEREVEQGAETNNGRGRESEGVEGEGVDDEGVDGEGVEGEGVDGESVEGEGVEGVRETGLVTTIDDIPEDEFLKMLGDDVMAGSHDHNVTDDDVTSQYNVKESNDPIDIVADSDDVIVQSHDQGKLLALILTPTRELALQVQAHITAAAKYTGIRVCALVGGMAGAKQERVLSHHPPIVVATPGRLWKLMSEGHPHLTGLDAVRFLVLDEADRMVEFGHYQELSWILERVNGARGAESGVKGAGAAGKGVGSGDASSFKQTFVFSATLTLPRRSAERKVKVRQRKNLSGQESVDTLISQVGLRHDAAVVDLSRHSGTVATLTETKIMCSAEEKDAYLYYFLLLFPGRTLVFVNSISTLQKLRSLLELLKLHPLPLHARMQQRQRLKNFDRFTTSPDGVLLASDVAARGLDFPSVQHVIHYHVPRNSELYVHRSGRTARAKKEGLSVMMIGPEDMASYRNICRTLNRDDLPSFPMDTSYLPAIHRRVGVARKIEAMNHKREKVHRDSDWLRSSAQAMELELDQDWYGMETQVSVTGTQETNKVDSLKSELDSLLRVPILPRSVSMAYPTRDENHKLLSGIKGVPSNHPWSERCNQIVTTTTRDALLIAKTETLRRRKHRRPDKLVATAHTH